MENVFCYLYLLYRPVLDLFFLLTYIRSFFKDCCKCSVACGKFGNRSRNRQKWHVIREHGYNLQDLQNWFHNSTIRFHFSDWWIYIKHLNHTTNMHTQSDISATLIPYGKLLRKYYGAKELR